MPTSMHPSRAPAASRAGTTLTSPPISSQAQPQLACAHFRNRRIHLLQIARSGHEVAVASADDIGHRHDFGRQPSAALPRDKALELGDHVARHLARRPDSRGRVPRLVVRDEQVVGR